MSNRRNEKLIQIIIGCALIFVGFLGLYQGEVSFASETEKDTEVGKNYDEKIWNEYAERVWHENVDVSPEIKDITLSAGYLPEIQFVAENAVNGIVADTTANGIEAENAVSEIVKLTSYASSERYEAANYDEAMSYLSDCLVARESAFSVKFYSRINISEYDNDVDALYAELSSNIKVVKEDAKVDIYREVAGNPHYGDYLRLNMKSYKLSYGYGCESEGEFEGESFYTLTFANVVYLDSYEEELAVDEKIAEILASDDFKDAEKWSEYRRAKTAYDYLMNTVFYIDGYYSTYNALIDKQSVCQGIATAFYRLCYELGLEVRIITGETSSGIKHAWNIVKIGDTYYDCDPTWAVTGRSDKYFLMGSEEFDKSHIRDARSSGEEFAEEYPTSVVTYQPSEEDMKDVDDSGDAPDDGPGGESGSGDESGDKPGNESGSSDDSGDKPGDDEKLLPEIRLVYDAHIQTFGWQQDLYSGQVAGTTGQSKRVEALKINVYGDEKLGVRYKTHVQRIGWQDWAMDGEVAGTVGQAKRVEAIKVELTGENAKYYDIYYRVHIQGIGWQDWTANGVVAGTVGQARRIEAFRIVVVKKSEKLDYVPDVCYKTHIQSYGWSREQTNGLMSGTTGEKKRVEAISIKLDGGRVLYKSHIQGLGWEDDWKKDGEVSGTCGEARRIEAIQIKLDGEIAEKYDIYYRVHVQGIGWMEWVSNGEVAGTCGEGRRVEAIEIRLKMKKGVLLRSQQDTFFYDTPPKVDRKRKLGGILAYSDQKFHVEIGKNST